MANAAQIILTLALCSLFAGGYTQADDTELVDGLPVADRTSYNIARLDRGLGMLRERGFADQEVHADTDTRQEPRIRLGLGKRQIPMLRLGKREFQDEDEKANLEKMLFEERELPMLRLALDKRQIPMLRLGKREFDDDNDNLDTLSFGKRQIRMLRLGKREFDDDNANLGTMSLGKRQLKMLRLGKRSVGSMQRFVRREQSKRSLGMLRLGKKSAL